MPYPLAATGRPVPARSGVRRWRAFVAVAGLLALVIKLLIAGSTFGTTDVELWTAFAQVVRTDGPVGIYGHQFVLVYNHAPLSGWMLMVINWCTDHGLGGFPFLIRVPASVADVFTGLLVFEFVRQRRSVREAALAAVLVVASPILVVVSGFHGNTDPLFVLFTLLAVYLLAVRGWSVLAGVSFALALSVKLVPIVVLPMLLVLAYRAGWRRVARFVAGTLLVFVPLWLPVLLTRWVVFKRDVLGYSGVELRQWGLVQVLKWFGLGPQWEAVIAGPGRFAILTVCAVLPALLVWRSPLAAPQAMGLALVLFLFLTPAFGMQYLSWAIAGAYLISTWAASAYNFFGSVFIIVVYDYWNGAYPPQWNIAPGKPFRNKDLILQLPVWASLGLVALVALRMLRHRRWRETPTLPPEPLPPAEFLTVRQGSRVSGAPS